MKSRNQKAETRNSFPVYMDLAIGLWFNRFTNRPANVCSEVFGKNGNRPSS
jgi:hypothetical protein